MAMLSRIGSHCDARGFLGPTPLSAMNASTPLRIGARGSALSRWQAEWVAAQLTQHDTPVEIIWIKTEGDVRSESLAAIGGQGLFTKEIQRALLDERVDLAVHSLKDLPTEPVAGLRLGAVPPRERSGDALVSSQYGSVDELPEGARVGTGSARRKAQLLYWRPDLQVLDIRGNVDTRLKKLEAGDYDAILLAEAGLVRLGLADRIRQTLPRARMLPAVGQGALGLEIRDGDRAAAAALTPLNDAPTLAAVQAERALLAALRAGCLAPVGAWGRLEEDGASVLLDAVVLDPPGRQRLTATARGPIAEAAKVGQSAAETLLAQGAAELISAAH